MDVAEKNEKKLRRQMRTTSKILLGFLLAILTGAVLLTLPVATVSGKSDFLTALFTATTSVCVTGLVVVAQDTTRYGEDSYGKSMLPELLTALCEIDGF